MYMKHKVFNILHEQIHEQHEQLQAQILGHHSPILSAITQFQAKGIAKSLYKST